MKSSLSTVPNALQTLPDRIEFLESVLRPTGRGAVPIRGAFIQARTEEDKGVPGLLAKFSTDQRALQAYLLIHALASSRDPHSATYPAITWAHAAGFTLFASETSARQRWSKAVKTLVELQLVRTSKDGRLTVYHLLHESGDGTDYWRPKTKADGAWVPLPHTYWYDGDDQQLNLAETLMLLISLDQKEPFELPAERVQGWYGLSKATAQRGFSGLAERGILSVEKSSVPDKNSTTLWRTTNSYSTQGKWTKAARKEAMKLNRKRRPKPTLKATT